MFRGRSSSAQDMRARLDRAEGRSIYSAPRSVFTNGHRDDVEGTSPCVKFQVLTAKRCSNPISYSDCVCQTQMSTRPLRYHWLTVTAESDDL